MKTSLTARETLLLAGVVAALVAVAAGPFVAQPADYHGFADTHTRWGVPNALDVLSNLAFALVGAAGLLHWREVHRALDRAQASLAWLACAGLLLTTAGSSWYHWHPDDAGLVVDRLGMSVAFAGLLGLAACRVSARAGLATGLAVLLAAPASVLHWHASGNLLPWVVLQLGGMVLLAALACTGARAGILPVRWGLVIGAYALAKLLEAGDHAIWHWTGELVSGHTLKHVVAAAAAWPLVAGLRSQAQEGQNARELPARAA